MGDDVIFSDAEFHYMISFKKRGLTIVENGATMPDPIIMLLLVAI